MDFDAPTPTAAVGFRPVKGKAVAADLLFFYRHFKGHAARIQAGRLLCLSPLNPLKTLHKFAMPTKPYFMRVFRSVPGQKSLVGGQKIANCICLTVEILSYLPGIVTPPLSIAAADFFYRALPLSGISPLNHEHKPPSPSKDGERCSSISLIISYKSYRKIRCQQSLIL